MYKFATKVCTQSFLLLLNSRIESGRQKHSKGLRQLKGLRHSRTTRTYKIHTRLKHTQRTNLGKNTKPTRRNRSRLRVPFPVHALRRSLGGAHGTDDAHERTLHSYNWTSSLPLGKESPCLLRVGSLRPRPFFWSQAWSPPRPPSRRFLHYMSWSNDDSTAR